MGLLSAGTSANRDVTNELTITYVRRLIRGQWSYTQGTQTLYYNFAWQYERHATKNYKYVGLSRSAAQTLAQSMITYYTRQTYVSLWNAGNAGFVTIDGGLIPMAEVTVQQVAGEMYDVNISVRETDTRLSMLVVQDIAGIFSTENQR